MRRGGKKGGEEGAAEEGEEEEKKKKSEMLPSTGEEWSGGRQALCMDSPQRAEECSV